MLNLMRELRDKALRNRLFIRDANPARSPDICDIRQDINSPTIPTTIVYHKVPENMSDMYY